MPYNLLLLPLCGGYFFLLNFVYTKYRYQRLSSQRLLFSSIITAIIILIITIVVRYIVSFLQPDLIPYISKFLNELPVRHVDYLWTSIFSFLLTLTGTIILNLILIIFSKPYKPISYTVRKYGDEIEKLFRVSAITGELMQLTLKNNKVYIGFTDIIPVPKETNYLKITPLLSGYRDSETKELIITTDYFEVLEKYMVQDPNFKIYDIDISLMQDEILSASIYSQQVWDLFHKDTLEDFNDSNLLE